MTRQNPLLDVDADAEASPELSKDLALERPLRPQRLGDYVGQAPIKEKLQIYIQAARGRREALDHCLFYGPPGLGKTSLAHIIAREMGSFIHSTSGPAIEKAGDLAALLTALEPLDILFIDEIHRLNPAVEEILYPAMEDRQLDIVIGQGPSARSLKIDLPPFTLIGATTRAGALTSPLRARFGIAERLNFYTTAELEMILLRSAHLLDIAIHPSGATEVARRARGTPRIVNRLLRRLRDIAQVNGNGTITAEIVESGLKLLDIDTMGFDPMDRAILLAIIETFQGGPVGIDTLSAALGEDKNTLEDVYEPYLIQEGFLQRTPRGRISTPRAYTHLGFVPPASLSGRSDQLALRLENEGELR